MKMRNNLRSKGMLAPLFAMMSVRVLVIAVGISVAFFTSTSFALYSDTKTSADSSFTTGTVKFPTMERVKVLELSK